MRNRKGVQKENITILKKIEKNHCKPLPIEVEEEGEQYKFVEENFSCFIRLISNEVRKVATFHYTSWENVPDQSKKAIIPTLFGTGGIEVFKETHYKLGKGWLNEIVESAYEIMKEWFKRSLPEYGDLESVNQIECTERALDQRRGHIRVLVVL
ncbi:hypothetical protein R6Q59_027995 [Mikania micrantha]